ncbi:hypothetical protein, variant 2 [Aphanomyces astaci]|uniref:Uncharacterized protein n=1 Tax=Aphanomyces astaci TaxID=112090 RepID=W4G175_APHAT|nr:hypothetical protein H257_11595 [Aphanomyces astaci]XP_009836886.1 hypothetical protein, variant 1 [Aphanomyces astaci]XP_009836887.1 hypothetical protein, variant 3 [Aphanomyces astaci]XP_009836888.1 hypothetical protein, variant 2 [Aphanomyces astaci]ETV73459.1 hypothetical protein H257_11595 [Aphanomyces astaci]ETV73460.1 hypothetical protein, variant 1 [Aphanomyces astaci]ETV73461.1 hypothetical protein, variant 2 [Aphanomyces astaci]ETV73462.1 hypothetical protein, variant 3 [Aphanom|eukprot:XP_009836885.1 hypothetical protein H257_11595 [Aphanomyces astaci]
MPVSPRWFCPHLLSYPVILKVVEQPTDAPPPSDERAATTALLTVWCRNNCAPKRKARLARILHLQGQGMMATTKYQDEHPFALPTLVEPLPMEIRHRCCLASMLSLTTRGA